MCCIQHIQHTTHLLSIALPCKLYFTATMTGNRQRAKNIQCETKTRWNWIGEDLNGYQIHKHYDLIQEVIVKHCSKWPKSNHSSLNPHLVIHSQQCCFYFMWIHCSVVNMTTFLTFHYLLYPVWLCMWQIIKNLEPRTTLQFLLTPLGMNVASLSLREWSFYMNRSVTFSLSLNCSWTPMWTCSRGSLWMKSVGVRRWTAS